MIEGVYIITQGGLCIWSSVTSQPRGSPINALVQQIILEQKASAKSFAYESYTLKWNFINELDLMIVIVFQTILALTYVDELLEITHDKFKDYLASIHVSKTMLESVTFDFKSEFAKSQRACEERAELAKEARKLDLQDKSHVKKDKSTNDTYPSPSVQPSKVTKQESETVSSPIKKTGDTIKDKIEEMKRAKQDAAQRKKDSKNKPKEVYVPTSQPKEMTTWKSDKFTEKSAKDLNFAKDGGNIDSDLSQFKKQYMSDKKESRMDEEDTYDDFDESQYAKKEQTCNNKGFFSYFTNLTGVVLDKENLEGILSELNTRLQGKNVAVTVAAEICKSIQAKLIGTTVGTFSTIKSTVQTAMEETLTRILTPNRHIDVLRDIAKAREQNRPYTAVFVGVNGVGKSTSLSKIAYWLKQNGNKVLIAACDTFRSGAVEQLRVHTKCLDVELFEKGYGKAPGAIAQLAVQYAKKNGFDVVLIDTAGRMQDNEPLMKALNELIVINDPDLVLFVGEALVGNDGVDQLVKFNSALVNIQKAENKERPIDGVVLTKYDTIDDKVGATISMVYSTGIPILFCGVGQTYNDLKKLSVKSVVQALLN